MNTEADRDVLYFEKINNISNNILQLSKESPPHKKNQNRGRPYLLWGKGSLTVEAAFSATIFFLALFSLLYLFSFLSGMGQVQMRLASAVQQYEAFGTKLGTAEGILKESVLLQWDEDKGICYVKQKKTIPFLGGSFWKVNLYQQMKINDYQGRSMVSEENTPQVYVYVTENGRVYHRDKGCVYLNPGIQSTRYDLTGSLRNRSGGKYGSCKSCCKGVALTAKSIVYLTPYGDCYHTDKKCSGLKRTIRKLLLSKTGLPACSKCGEEKKGTEE